MDPIRPDPYASVITMMHALAVVVPPTVPGSFDLRRSAHLPPDVLAVALAPHQRTPPSSRWLVMMPTDLDERLWDRGIVGTAIEIAETVILEAQRTAARAMVVTYEAAPGPDAAPPGA